MSRKKREGKTIVLATARLQGVKSIDQKLDLGAGITADAFTDKIAVTQAALDDYNRQLSLTDQKQSIYEQHEKELAELHERILLGVATRYGKDSNEYEMAGGTRRSERARPTRPAKPPAT